MWGLNAVSYAFGIGSYYNPYYTTPVYVDNQQVVAYDQPIVGDAAYESAMPDTAVDAGTVPADTANVPVDATNSATEAPAAPDPLTETFNAARQAFSSGDYDQALNLTNQSLKLAPRDAAINEFRSLCLFALKQYQESSATIHAVLAAGPGWDWTTMISLYSNPGDYTTQLRQLEEAAKATPDDAALHFLLGYHYLTCNYKANAVTQWKHAAQLQPKDQLSAQLVQIYSAPADSAETAVAPKPEFDAPAYPMEKLQGTWKAKSDAGEFEMKLGNDDKFTWSFIRDGKPQSVTGVYAVRGNSLVMQPDTGGTMLANITLKDDQTLEFTPINNSSSMTFHK